MDLGYDGICTPVRVKDLDGGSVGTYTSSQVQREQAQEGGTFDGQQLLCFPESLGQGGRKGEAWQGEDRRRSATDICIIHVNTLDILKKITESKQVRGQCATMMSPLEERR